VSNVNNRETISRVRIAVATHFFPTSTQPHRGLPIYQLTRALSSIVDVQVFCVDPLYPSYKLLQQRTFLNPAGDASYTVPGVKVKYLHYHALPFLSRGFNGYNCARVLTSPMRDFRPDIIIGYFIYPSGFAALTVAETLKVPVIVGALGSDLRGISNFTRMLSRRTMRKASFVVTVSDDLREIAIKHGISPDRTVTIHNGCDFDIFHPADRGAARAELHVEPAAELIVFTGRLVPGKGLRELLQAVAILAPSHPRLRLVCIGEGVMDQELRQRASQPDLRGYVKFLGNLNADQIARWLAASNVFCLPSYSEGCPNVIIEALACGRPVVATNVGGIPELMDSRCGILVPPRDAKALADALAKTLEYPWNQDQISSSFRRTWQDMARETYDLCRSLVRTS
jgi:teichuronic acid biosynthesis glycosyltransferase TuaC